MMLRRMAVVLLFIMSPPAFAVDDDAAWIDRYVAVAARAEADAALQARSVAFSQLPQMIGTPVRLFLRGGAERRGTVDAVGGGKVRLKGLLKGGYFSYDVPRQQIVRIEKDGTR